MSYGRADHRIDLVSSSSTDDTPSVFTENEVLTSSLFFTGPLTKGKGEHKRKRKAKGKPCVKLSVHTAV